MKKTTTLLLSLFLCIAAFAVPVDEPTARKAGQHFLSNRTNSSTLKQNLQLELAYVSAPKTTVPAGNVFFYVFNVSNGNGFVIVSGDDQAAPILAYSDEKDFSPENIAPQTAKWLEGYKDQVRYIVQNNLPQTGAIKREWESLTTGKPEVIQGKKAGVNPLVTTRWDQTNYYSTLCPGGSVTGCVATAMAQVMKFWNYPATGNGFHSYSHSQYGTLSADFGSTTYNWAGMPNSVNSSNNAVATLMYHAGVSVDMNYSPESSGAYVISSQSAGTHCAEYAFETYFGYKSSLSGIERSNYNETQWVNLLKNELDLGRPTLYAGFGTGGGHAFVCDGYDNNSFFHFNWGWGGYQDGYFAINALNPGGTGTGGGTGGFNNGHQLIIGIEPGTGGGGGGGGQADELALNVDVMASATNIYYGAPFTISTRIVNTGTTTFTGTYCAALFDANGIFVDYIDSLTESNGLPAGYTYTNNLEFSSPGSFNILPADNYQVLIFYKPFGGNWKRIFGQTSGISDYTLINIKNPSDIEMYADMVPTPGTFVKGQSASVQLDIANVGASGFSGLLDLSLFNLDGTFAAAIEQKTGLTLPSNSHYQNGLTFTTSELDVEPGTYLLALQYRRTGSQNSYLVGSTAYQNPVKITVIDPPIPADQYEVNNSVSQAYNLALSFSNNTATKKTVGANCHIGSDYDYYKFVLPSGYNYTINARIHDAYSAGNSQTYTLDGLISYSTDGINWSDAFDDVLDPFVMNGGGTVYFMISPYFSGQTGTYMFDATVTRNNGQQQSVEKEITGFSVTGIVGNAAINSSAATVNIIVTSTTDVSALIPTIAISPLATINPNSGVARNFTSAVNYTVTAQDGSTKDWTVTITKQSPTAVNTVSKDDNIQVYPNPASELLNLDLSLFDDDVKSLVLVDASGKQHTINVALDAELIEIPLTRLSAGFYILKIETASGIISKKIVIQP